MEEINIELLEKKLFKLRKNNKKLAHDLNCQQRIFDCIRQHVNKLSSQNQEILYNFMNNMPYPNIMRSDIEWFKIPQNINTLNMRIRHVDLIFTNPNNWDRKDPELRDFLKRLIHAG